MLRSRQYIQGRSRHNDAVESGGTKETQVTITMIRTQSSGDTLATHTTLENMENSATIMGSHGKAGVESCKLPGTAVV